MNLIETSGNLKKEMCVFFALIKKRVWLRNSISCIDFSLVLQQQEQDPTNLYIANLPLNFKENDVEGLLAQYGQVISTRILRDTSGQSKGVGFAR